MDIEKPIDIRAAMLYDVSRDVKQTKGVHMAGIIGGNLRRLRLNAKLSQEKLAEAMGVHQSTVAYWENVSTWSPKAESMAQLCQIFNVSPDDFYQDFGGNEQEEG